MVDSNIFDPGVVLNATQKTSKAHQGLLQNSFASRNNSASFEKLLTQYLRPASQLRESLSYQRHDNQQRNINISKPPHLVQLINTIRNKGNLMHDLKRSAHKVPHGTKVADIDAKAHDTHTKDHNALKKIAKKLERFYLSRLSQSMMHNLDNDYSQQFWESELRRVQLEMGFNREELGQIGRVIFDQLKDAR